MLNKTKKISLCLIVSICLISAGSIGIGSEHLPFIHNPVNFPSEEMLQEQARLERLDSYSLDSFTDVSGTVNPNGNHMNVIMMIPDGQNASEQTLARWYQGSSLATDEYLCGMVRTYSAESAITDSAAAATAYATGYKTNEGYIGLFPAISDMPGATAVNDINYQMPIATVLESARLAGKSTGFVVTSPIMHATPASFSAHAVSRTLYPKIAKQQIYSGIDVMLGGGSYYLRDGRDDGRDLISDAQKLGYSFVTDRSSLRETTANKVLGTFASLDMNYDFDRSESEPSLEEMTVKAIELLNRNENGFFLLVEGSKTDYASHAHDPVGVVSESLSYDKAFRAAVEFAKKDGNTIVISCADHGNGGMTIGVGQSGYAQTNISSYIEPLKRASRTGAGLYREFDSSRSNAREVVEKYYGITDLTDEEISKIKTTNEVMAAVGAMMSKRAYIGWIAGGHTGEDVPLSIYAPEGYGLHGLVDNTDISHLMQSFLGVDNNSSTSELFVPVRDLFADSGAKISYEIISQSRAVLIIEKNGTTMRLPVDTSIAIVNDSVYRLGGVTVVSNGTTYVCRDAAELFANVTSDAAK